MILLPWRVEALVPHFNQPRNDLRCAGVTCYNRCQCKQTTIFTPYFQQITRHR